jgi:deoxycytidine triphosphate deaminase
MRPERPSFSALHPSTWSPFFDRRASVRATQTLESNEALVIPPNGVTIVTTEEKVHFDADIVGRLSLKMDLLVRGLIMASQGQMDAGYVGHVFALFYNLSDREISITRGDPILRLELIRLHTPSTRPYDASGDYQNKKLGAILAGPVGSSLQDMRFEVEEASGRLRRTRWGGALLAVFGVMVPTLLLAASGVTGSISSLRDRVAELEGSNKVLLNRLDRSADYRRLCLEINRVQRGNRMKPKLNCR